MLALTAGNTVAQEAGDWYVKLDLGGNVLEDTELKAFPGVGGDRDMDSSPGGNLHAGVGYRIIDWLAVEFESGITGNEIDSIAGASEVDAGIYTVPFMFNVVAQCNNLGPWHPFVGVGAGGSSVIMDIDEITIGQDTVFGGSEGDVVFSWQGFAGLRYQFNENWSAGLTYRYRWIDDASWDVESGPWPYWWSVDHDAIKMGELHQHLVTLGFTYSF
jgi:opacity protein-like surface antigen